MKARGKRGITVSGFTVGLMIVVLLAILVVVWVSQSFPKLFGQSDEFIDKTKYLTGKGLNWDALTADQRASYSGEEQANIKFETLKKYYEQAGRDRANNNYGIALEKYNRVISLADEMLKDKNYDADQKAQILQLKTDAQTVLPSIHLDYGKFLCQNKHYTEGIAQLKLVTDKDVSTLITSCEAGKKKFDEEKNKLLEPYERILGSAFEESCTEQSTLQEIIWCQVDVTSDKAIAIRLLDKLGEEKKNDPLVVPTNSFKLGATYELMGGDNYWTSINHYEDALFKHGGNEQHLDSSSKDAALNALRNAAAKGKDYFDRVKLDVVNVEIKKMFFVIERDAGQEYAIYRFDPRTVKLGEAAPLSLEHYTVYAKELAQRLEFGAESWVRHDDPEEDNACSKPEFPDCFQSIDYDEDVKYVIEVKDGAGHSLCQVDWSSSPYQSSYDYSISWNERYNKNLELRDNNNQHTPCTDLITISTSWVWMDSSDFETSPEEYIKFAVQYDVPDVTY